MKTLANLLLLLLMNTMLWSQESAVAPCDGADCRTVIATGGLNMRSAPNAKASRVTAVPFGAQVSILEDSASGVLNIGKVEGCWQKVSYKQQSGYMFSPYLSREYFPIDKNTPVHLYTQGAGCQNNMRYNPRYSYRAVVREDDGSYQLKEVKLSFHVVPNTIAEGAEVLIYEVEGAEQPLLVIGRAKWAQEPGKITGFGRHDEICYLGNPDFEKREEAHTTTVPGVQGYSLYYAYEEEENGREYRVPYLVLKHGPSGTEQRIGGQGTENYCYDLLVWAGDLDGDGEADFVLESEKYYAYLYLSSDAKKGQLLKRVAAFMGGYCC